MPTVTQDAQRLADLVGQHGDEVGDALVGVLQLGVEGEQSPVGLVQFGAQRADLRLTRRELRGAQDVRGHDSSR